MKKHDKDLANRSNRTGLALARRTLPRRVRKTLRRLWRDQRGANFLEYGVLAIVIGVAGITFVGNFGTAISGAFQRLTDAVKTIGTGQSPAAGSPAPTSPAGGARAAAELQGYTG